jgi:uncharacterized Fe-S cluster-containing radical SAM superfamily enzyme
MKKPTELTLKQSLSRVSSLTKSAPHRMNLSVSFQDKDQAKALGAKWDGSSKTWYINADADMRKFYKWLPRTK